MSDFYNKYPYTDFHELNLDWVIGRVKKLTEDWLATHEEWVGMQQDWADTEQAWIDFKAYVENYLANLDVQDEIDHKIDQMIADGSLRTIIQPDVLTQTISTTTNWLDAHITQPTTPVIDNSLTIQTAGADSLSAGLLIKNNFNKILGIQDGQYQIINFSMAMVLYDHAIMLDNNTTLSTLSSCTLSIKDNTIKSIIIPQLTTPLNNYPAVLLRNNGSLVAWTTASDAASTTFDCSGYTFDEVVINYWGCYTTPYYTYISALYDKLATENNLNALPHFSNLNNFSDVNIGKWNINDSAVIDMDNVHNLEPGYCTLAGIVYSSTHYHLFINAKDIKSISITPGSDTPSIEYALYMKTKTSNNATALIGVNGGTYYAQPRFTDGYIVINCFMGNDYAHSFTLNTWPDIDNHIMHSVNKPFDFYNKTAVFAGDSITAGFTSGSTTTPNNYPKLFSDRVGLSYNNIAIGGALFTAGYNAVTTIVDQVKSIATTPDFIFIAGGVNDWNMGVTLTEIKNSVNDLCSWINTNKPTSEVIWILPINEAGWETTHVIHPTASLEEFRTAIYEVVTINNLGKYSVVNGKLFNFPVMGDNVNFINSVFGDLLHPSELGYRALYAQGLFNALC